jgi:hypothetical protein
MRKLLLLGGSLYYLVLHFLSANTHTHLCVYTYSLLVRVSYIVYSWSSLSIFFVLILLFLFLITLHFLSSFFRAAHRDRHHAASDIVAPAGDITTQLLNTFPSVRTYTHQSRIPRFDSPPGKRSYLAIHYIVYIKADDAPSYLLHPTTEYQHTSKKKKQFGRPSRTRLMLHTGRNTSTFALERRHQQQRFRLFDFFSS